MNIILRVLLWTLVAMHMILVVATVASFFIVPFYTPWYVALPIMIYIGNLMFTHGECPLTNLENHIRRALGMKRIGGFVGHYLFRPAKNLLGIKRTS